MDRTRTVARARGVSYRYGAAPPAVSRIDLEIPAGRVVAIAGPNGAGKSTLLQLMIGTLRPGEGRVEVIGGGREKSGSHVGYLGQDVTHLTPLSGTQNARFFARACGMGTAAATHAIAEHFARFGMTDLAHRPVSTYSHGTARKLALVEALQHRPSFIVLDEPTAGLDIAARATLLRLLRERADEGAGILVASHDLELVLQLADHVTFLHRGHMVAEGHPLELVSSLVGQATRFDIELEKPPRTPITSVDSAVVVRSEGTRLVLESSRGQAALPLVCGALVEAGARISALSIREPGLAEVFRHLTGEELGG